MVMIGYVQQVQCLDEKGYWIHRTIFLNMDKTFCKGLTKVINDKTVPNSYTTVRKVEYA